MSTYRIKMALKKILKAWVVTLITGGFEQSTGEDQKWDTAFR